MTFSVPQVAAAAAVVVYPMQALSVRRLECITVCAKDEFFMIYYTSCSVFADLHRCLAKIFGGFAAKNEEAEATFVTCHHPPPHKKNRLQGLCEKSQRIHFENYIYLAYFFAVHFPSFRLGRKTNANVLVVLLFFSLFLFSCFFLLCSLCQKFLKKTTRITYFKVVPSASPIAPSLPWPTAPVPHVARRTSQHPYYSSSSSSISVIYYCSPSCRKTMCNNIIDGGAGGGEVIIFRK